MGHKEQREDARFMDGQIFKPRDFRGVWGNDDGIKVIRVSASQVLKPRAEPLAAY